MRTPKELLEAYLQAKDLDQPSVIPDCYAPEAVLTFSIATDQISFPTRVRGAYAIAQTLVGDFRRRFDCCKTYYVCDSLAGVGVDIDFLPWLVVMRERSTSALRLGKGYYRWAFERGESRMWVAAMHIHIERMDIIEDGNGEKREQLHAALPYPWLRPAVLAGTFERLSQQSPGFAFLSDFSDPVTRPARR
ncbi:MAG: hypothetical protein ABI771_08755 [Betaproteobacteria bacterium]